MTDKDPLLTEDDKALFEEAMKGVVPLNSPNIIQPPQKKVPHIKRRRHHDDFQDLKQTAPFYLSDYVALPLDSNAHVTHQNHSVQSHQMHAFKRGDIHVEARLDLHGNTPDNAKIKFLRFLEDVHERNLRCVLIIHGKGGKDYEKPVLKNLVLQWLKQIPYVLAFTTAKPNLGGAGAVCVLISRKKEKLD